MTCISIYNPYSIVKETLIAKIGSTHGKIMSTADTRETNAELVELIGIEPTTPCLQSRCSPS